MKQFIILIGLFISFSGIHAQEEYVLLDQVIMVDGQSYKGKIVDSNLNKIVFILEGGNQLEIDKSEISKYYQHFDNDDTFVWINKEKKQTITPRKSIEIENDRYQKVSEYGINLAGLISQFVPFGRSSTATGPYNFTYRKGKGNNYFHLQLGININSEDFFNDIGHFNAAIGYMRKKQVNDKFKYYNTFDLMGFGGSFNEPDDDPNGDLDNGGIGVGFGFGIEYEIYKNILVGTETILYLGSPSIDFVSPVGIYLIARFER